MTRFHLWRRNRVVARNESGPGSEPTTAVVPLWYRLLRLPSPERPRPGTMGTRGTLPIPKGVRLGVERSPLAIRTETIDPDARCPASPASPTSPPLAVARREFDGLGVLPICSQYT